MAGEELMGRVESMADLEQDPGEGRNQARAALASGDERSLRIQVREFETRLNRIERAFIPCSTLKQEPAAPSGGPEAGPGLPQVGGPFSLQAVEREHIERVIARSSSFQEAARILGIDQSTLYRKRKRYLNGQVRGPDCASALAAYPRSLDSGMPAHRIAGVESKPSLWQG
jgi:DNA-binding NtrC family response regulator